MEVIQKDLKRHKTAAHSPAPSDQPFLLTSYGNNLHPPAPTSATLPLRPGLPRTCRGRQYARKSRHPRPLLSLQRKTVIDESWETHSHLRKPSQRHITGQHRPCQEMSSRHLHAGGKPPGHRTGVLGRRWLQGTKKGKQTDRCTVPAARVTDRQRVPDS